MLICWAHGDYREVWTDDAGLDGRAEEYIETSIQPPSVDLSGVRAWLFVDGADGAPDPRLELDVNNGCLRARVRNVAAPGNVVRYTLDIWYRDPDGTGVQAVVQRTPFVA